MEYYFFQKDMNNYVYSIDNIIIKTSVFPERYDELLSYLKLRSSVKEDSRPHYYRYMFFLCFHNTSIRVFLNLNTIDDTNKPILLSNVFRVKIEFNPNTAMSKTNTAEVVDFLSKICSMCSPDIWLTTFDLAVDIPYEYRFVNMKNANTYNGTQYYRKRWNDGAMKVYDKGQLVDISEWLTRIEMTVTVPASQRSIDKIVPKIVSRCPNIFITISSNSNTNYIPTDKAVRQRAYAEINPKHEKYRELIDVARCNCNPFDMLNKTCTDNTLEKAISKYLFNQIIQYLPVKRFVYDEAAVNLLLIDLWGFMEVISVSNDAEQ